MAAKTAKDLIYELGYRLGDLVLSTPSGGGSVTTLIDQTLLQYWPVDVLTQFYPWVYGTSTADTNNRGVERRAKAWTGGATYTLTLHPPGFTDAIATGIYELRQRWPRARILAAINDAVGLLNVGWYRLFVDTSITTATSTWKYTLPSSQSWQQVTDVEIQVNTVTGMETYPYMSATGWNWKAYPSTTTAGVTVWVIQFGLQPPPNRTLRVWGQGNYVDLVTDTDVLASAAMDEQKVWSWIYRYAAHSLLLWEASRLPSGMPDNYVKMSQVLMQEAQQIERELAPPNRGNKVVVPGRGTGRFPSDNTESPGYFGAFSSAANN